jgi:hypothetical protein
MEDLQTRLHDFWQSREARRIARGAPLLLLSGLAGATLGTVAALPASAAGGVLGILTGLSVNFTSDVIKQLVYPERDDFIADEDTREDVLRQELEQGNADAQLLVSLLLNHAGPNLAQALPADTRDERAADIGRAMQQAGGPLAQIAPRYAAALRDPATDWDRLRAELAKTVSTTSTQTIEAANISDTEQRSTGYDYSDQKAKAQQDITGLKQIASRNPGGKKSP